MAKSEEGLLLFRILLPPTPPVVTRCLSSNVPLPQAYCVLNETNEIEEKTLLGKTVSPPFFLRRFLLDHLRRRQAPVDCGGRPQVLLGRHRRRRRLGGLDAAHAAAAAAAAAARVADLALALSVAADGP